MVTLTWTAQAGEHEYRIEAWESGKLEASRSGSVLEEIYFAGIPVWTGVNDDSVKIPITSKRTVTVLANSENDDMGFEIIFNDNLAEKLFTADYFLSPGGSYYKYLLTPGGQPAIYRVAVKLSTGQIITYDICLLPNTVNVTGYEIVGGSSSGAGVILAFLNIDVGTLLTVGGLLLYFYPSIKAPSLLGATETDNNLIGGG
ncbi:hypothetical protein [Thermococcus thioreducens]|uniref:Uncharacterized protein n=1 Tax=Thermococcus thioreducens TaxID=277988 RepID=A0A0Q2MPR2_9EURY|nr:hypothetical protein [Thermococcus thioreducens]ASJ13474.1 hypothetical protein A3L14_11545 [Thermococcus thioreducens]KQH81663.1 hypothetical protein AMR53_10180 [Thermococcus thioreducens]SEV96636.1 hypothetical protein SAMN05216170_1141 [Thermococcus thioreducens]